MFVVEHIKDETVHLRFSNLSRITAQVAEEFRTELVKHMYHGYRDLIIDLENICYIDAKGFETLLYVSQLARDKNIHMTLCNVSDETFELINIMQMKDDFVISGHPLEVISVTLKN
jgi:anti-anti-sigma factor